MKNKEKIIIVLITIIFIFMFFLQHLRMTEKINNQKSLYESTQDTLKIWKDKDSLNHSKISVLETERVQDFIKLKSKDKEILELQKEVIKYKKQLKEGGSVTIIETQTKFDTAYIKVPLGYSDSLYQILTLIDSIQNNWINTKFGFDKGKTYFSLQTKDKYSVIIGSEKQGLFKKPKTYVEVINHNPYTETNKLRTYQVSQKRVSRFGIGPFIGIDYRGKLSIGAGLQYNLIRL